MSLPRVLIPVPTSFDEPYNAQSWPEYAKAVVDAGGEPIQLALTHSHRELQAMVESAEAILLPGSGADVSPVRYGHAVDPRSAEPDPLREQTDWTLLEAAERTRKPLLGICFGTQALNVYRGGTLVQDLEPMPVNHRAGRSVLSAHGIRFAKESRLGRILLPSDEARSLDDEFAALMVNSSHHQSVLSAGDNLRVAARSVNDGVIEAVEGDDPDHWLLGVQWHPERTMQHSAASRAIFAEFLRRAQ